MCMYIREIFGILSVPHINPSGFFNPSPLPYNYTDNLISHYAILSPYHNIHTCIMLHVDPLYCTLFKIHVICIAA